MSIIATMNALISRSRAAAPVAPAVVAPKEENGRALEIAEQIIRSLRTPQRNGERDLLISELKRQVGYERVVSKVEEDLKVLRGINRVVCQHLDGPTPNKGFFNPHDHPKFASLLLFLREDNFRQFQELYGKEFGNDVRYNEASYFLQLQIGKAIRFLQLMRKT